ncbi:MAG: hypothetical protein SYR96_04490 [Actinomycetota bacterium]|nr:hypothetical protein [Actinomycetota bacterium]
MKMQKANPQTYASWPSPNRTRTVGAAPREPVGPSGRCAGLAWLQLTPMPFDVRGRLR